MIINLPYKVRAGLYLFTMVGTPVVAYLLNKDIIGELELGLWSAEVAIVSALAAFNTKPTEEEL